MAAKPYTVYIYEQEAAFISERTLQFLKVETGGDLFGLWLNESEVVIQIVLGPGSACKRKTTSFFQDEHYLSDVGTALAQSHGLCNVGSWHSHHIMNLPEPSSGDRATIWRHLPSPGRFLLLIATIDRKVDGPKVGMTFNLFESGRNGKRICSMSCRVLKGKSPFRMDESLSSFLLSGAESRDVTPKIPLQTPVRDSRQCEGDMTMKFFQKSTRERRINARDNDRMPSSRQHIDNVYWKPIGGKAMLYHKNHPVGHCRERRINARDNDRMPSSCQHIHNVYWKPMGDKAVLYHKNHPFGFGDCRECSPNQYHGHSHEPVDNPPSLCVIL